MLVSHFYEVIALYDGSKSPKDLIVKISKKLCIINLLSFFLVFPQT